MTALITDVTYKSTESDPNPENDIGPRIMTAIPPPNSIRIHIVKRNR